MFTRARAGLNEVDFKISSAQLTIKQRQEEVHPLQQSRQQYPSSARREPTLVDPPAAGGTGIADELQQRQPLPPPPTARPKPAKHDGAEREVMGDEVNNEVKVKVQREVIYEEVKVQAENDASGSSPSSHVCKTRSRTKWVHYALATIAPKRNSSSSSSSRTKWAR